ncbi:MAG: hypothetical protein Fur0041_04530 [Bacteroidia bacterium]
MFVFDSENDCRPAMWNSIIITSCLLKDTDAEQKSRAMHGFESDECLMLFGE